jgi:predicted lipoprotein with Yx(FWY)xxD motif
MRRVLFALIVALIVPSSTMASSVQVRHSAYGPVLFSGSGRALYLFTADRTRRSTCYGACARAWPPFYAKGRAIVRGGARRGLLGTTRRRNGRRQVTYAGHPLYFYVGDPVGQIRCQNVFEFGGTWLVVSPGGRAVR